MTSPNAAAKPVYGIDPLYLEGIDGWVIVITLAKTAITFGVLLVAVMFMVWFERKVIADMQNRIGPNRAGPFGILQTLADGIKLFFKEPFIPGSAMRKTYYLAPYLAAVPAFLSFAIVPIGPQVSFGSYTTNMQLADPPIGILWLLMMSSIAVYGVILAGWSSGSKYPLLGGVRASAQMISYEAAIGLSIAAAVLVSGSVVTSEVVAAQQASILDWNIIATGIVPFVIFWIAATAEANRPPFDLVEAEQELVGGFNTEYSAIRFSLFFLAEFMNTVTMSAIIVTLFLGGPTAPGGITDDLPGQWAWGIFWFLAKVFIFLFCFVWLRATLPRFRYDQLMDLGWKKLIPAALGWVLIVGAIQVSDDTDAADLLRNTGIMVIIVALGALVLWRAIAVGRLTREPSQLVEEEK